MIDPERLAAFAVMTAATSVVPGVSMVFLMGQTLRGGWRSGATALGGMQLGYLVWWLLAALGLGTLAIAFPTTFRALAIGGALYLAWLGVEAFRGGGKTAPADEAGRSTQLPATSALHRGALVALGNPKALVYTVALLPPFIDQGAPIVPQIVLLAAVGTMIDVFVGSLYIAVGARLSQAMTRPTTRRRIDFAIGTIFLAIAAGVLIDALRQ